MAFWRLPYVLAEVSASRFNLRRSDTGQAISYRPLIAVEETNGKLIIRSFGEEASATLGKAGFQVVNPFESLEPLFVEIDFAVAIFAHGIREIDRQRRAFAPGLALSLKDRHSPLSDTEIERCSEIADRIGVRNMRIFLGQSAPSWDDISEFRVLPESDYAIKLANRR